MKLLGGIWEALVISMQKLNQEKRKKIDNFFEKSQT